eukprot:3795031-Karenia_brevis.AAC.1
MVIDVRKDPIKKIVVQLTRGLAFVADPNEPGAAEQEEDMQVRHAWKFGLTLANQAHWNFFFARCLEYALIIANLAAIALVTFTTGTEEQHVTACLPILSGLLLAVLAKCDFTSRWAVAWLAAQDMVREIYLFRARAGDYHTPVKHERPQQVLSRRLQEINGRCEDEQGLTSSSFCWSKGALNSRKVRLQLQPGFASTYDYEGEEDDGCSLVT